MTKQPPTKELGVWTSEFGRKYTDRNPIAIDAMDLELGEWYKCGRKSDLFRQFVGPDRLPSGRVLEVGSNVGAQLAILRTVNPNLELFGLEPMTYAIEKGREYYPEISFVQGTAFDIPYPDNHFDLVMTNTVLIHINPNDIPRALSEIHRVTRKYIFFDEYYADQLTEVSYYGQKGLMWKTNFMQRYLDLFSDLKQAGVRYLNYPDVVTGEPLVNQVALLEKSVGGK